MIVDDWAALLVSRSGNAKPVQAFDKHSSLPEGQNECQDPNDQGFTQGSL